MTFGSVGTQNIGALGWKSRDSKKARYGSSPAENASCPIGLLCTTKQPNLAETASHQERPEGGDGGGRVVAVGTPEMIAKEKDNYTGQFLKALFERRPASQEARSGEATTGKAKDSSDGEKVEAAE